MKVSFYKAWSKTHAVHADGSFQDEANILLKEKRTLEGNETKQMQRQNENKRASKSQRNMFEWVLEQAASSDGCKNTAVPEEESNS